MYEFLAFLNFEMWTQAFFLDISKKTQAQKNSKLKENPEKTQAKFPKNSKTGNSSWVELVLNRMKTPFSGENLKVLLKTAFLSSNIFKNLKIPALFWNIPKKLMKKTQNSSKILKKLKPKFQKNSKNGNSSGVELAENRQKKPVIFPITSGLF